MWQVLGVIIMALGVITGLWVALWWGWIGGIVQVVDGIKANPTDAMEIAIGIVRVLFANFVGAVVGWFIFACGAFVAHIGEAKRRYGRW